MFKIVHYVAGSFRGAEPWSGTHASNYTYIGMVWNCYSNNNNKNSVTFDRFQAYAVMKLWMTNRTRVIELYIYSLIRHWGALVIYSVSGLELHGMGDVFQQIRNSQFDPVKWTSEKLSISSQITIRLKSIWPQDMTALVQTTHTHPHMKFSRREI